MRLKAIELQGFKSFPDKTRITFDSGVTAIIGPNGSGKSNISDAIRWVLGEMSVKSLRGNRMEDVIFNGTASRAAANCAIVSLFIDTEEEYNTAKHQTIEPISDEADDESDENKSVRAVYRLSDEPEVSVSRKYYRSGESEYYINKKQVRLKDIYELFYDTGIGREGYSVIGQGKIAEVLSQKDEERRSIFEEAAGISRFRYKKLEAERKLRDTENNLIRVNDIINEIGSRIGPLAKEAENAQQYLVLSEEKKGLEITLWLDRLNILRQRRVECETELAAANLALDNAERDASECENATDKLLNANYEFGRVMSECESEKTSAVHKKGEAEGKRAVCDNDISHANESINSAKSVIAESENALEEAQKATAECLAAKTEAERALAKANEKCTAAEAEYDKARANSQVLDAEAAKAQNAFELLSAESGILSAKIAAAEASLDAGKRAESENRERIAAGKQRIAELDQSSDDAKSALALQEEKRSEIETEIKTVESNRFEKSDDINRISDELTAEKVKLSALEQRYDNLKRLEQLLEGYSDSVKHVLNDCTSGKITDKGRAMKPYGTVSNIISTESDYVVALETALAASVQFIVVDKESDAKACMRYLKDNKLGRATFLPIESVKGRTFDDSKIKNMPGYIGLASDIAKSDKKFDGIVKELLGRTVIAENIELATSMAHAAEFKVKIVTLDGQVINAGGSYTGGSVHGKVGVFTRARDIERLEADIKTLRDSVAKLESERTAAYAEQSASEEKIKALTSDLGAVNDRIGEISAELRSYAVRIEEERAHIAAVSASDGDNAKLESELNSIYTDKQNLDAAINAAITARDEARRSADKAKSAEEDSLHAVNDARMTLYTRNNELIVLGERLNGCLDRETGIKARIELSGNTIKTAEALIADRLAEIGRINAECAECDSVIAGCETKLQSLISGREENEKTLADLRTKQKALNSAKEEAFRAVTVSESKRDAANIEYDTVTNKLWDEYELTYSDAERYRLPPEKMDKAATRLNSLKNKIRSMGVINVNAVEEYRVTKERYDFLTKQTEDLNKTRASLDKTIARLSAGMKETFLEYFDKINVEFNTVFTELFGGGSARVELTDPMLPLECGIEIILKVPGKSVRSISLLSGGEQTFAAISLYLALQRVNPAPFCVFDEIESALDDVNIVKFASFIRRNSEKTQYIIITHRRGTMEHADTLYGITMHQKGVSDFMRLNMAKLDERFKENIN